MSQRHSRRQKHEPNEKKVMSPQFLVEALRELAESQVELNEDAKKCLYENRLELYL